MKIKTEDLVMLQDQLLVKPYKFRYSYEVQHVVDHDDSRNKNKDPEKDIMHLKEVKERVLDGNYQTVEVVVVSKDNRLNLVTGDIVVVDWRKSREFDLIKGTSLILAFEIVCRLYRLNEGPSLKG